MSCPLCPHCRAEQARADALANLAGALREVRDRVARDSVNAEKHGVVDLPAEEAVYEQAGGFTVPRRKRPWDSPTYGKDGRLTGVVDFLDGHQAAELGESPRCPNEIVDRAEWRKGWRQGRADMEEQEARMREWSDYVETNRRKA